MGELEQPTGTSAPCPSPNLSQGSWGFGEEGNPRARSLASLAPCEPRPLPPPPRAVMGLPKFPPAEGHLPNYSHLFHIFVQ